MAETRWRLRKEFCFAIIINDRIGLISPIDQSEQRICRIASFEFRNPHFAGRIRKFFRNKSHSFRKRSKHFRNIFASPTLQIAITVSTQLRNGSPMRWYFSFANARTFGGKVEPHKQSMFLDWNRILLHWRRSPYVFSTGRCCYDEGHNNPQRKINKFRKRKNLQLLHFTEKFMNSAESWAYNSCIFTASVWVLECVSACLSTPQLYFMSFPCEWITPGFCWLIFKKMFATLAEWEFRQSIAASAVPKPLSLNHVRNDKPSKIGQSSRRRMQIHGLVFIQLSNGHNFIIPKTTLISSAELV